MDDLMEALEERQENEKALLQGEIKLMMKGAKKAKKRDLETKAMQMEYELRAKHIEQTDFLEEHGKLMNEEEEEDTCSKGPHTEAQETATVTGVTGTEEAHIIQHTSPPIPTSVTEQEENSQGLSKKEKAQRKKDKKLQKARDQQEEKDKLRETLADLPSQREDELALLNQQLLLEGLEVKNVAADGHCLYRAIADQLQLTSRAGQSVDSVFNLNTISFINIRQLAADQMRTHVDVYAPFLALSGPCAEYDAYCDSVESITAANWGGQTELNAIAASLGVSIWVYEVGRPVLKMGVQSSASVTPLKVTYHRHFYALGEHYNSVKLLA